MTVSTDNNVKQGIQLLKVSRDNEFTGSREFG